MRMPCVCWIDPNFSLGFFLIYCIKLNLSLFSELSLIPCSAQKACSSPAAALSSFCVVQLLFAHCVCLSPAKEILTVRLLWLPFVLQGLYLLACSQHNHKSSPRMKAQICCRKGSSRVAAMPVMWTGAWDLMDPKVLSSPAGTLLHERNN